MNSKIVERRDEEKIKKYTGTITQKPNLYIAIKAQL